jgi:hypothetical protein
MFLNALVEIQNRKLERGEPEPEHGLFDRATFKEAMIALSEYKLVRGLFAEYPDLRPHIDALRETKTEHNLESLSRIWKKGNRDALDIARQLKGVGFFEERLTRGETSYWVPFVYRPYLAMSQGKAEELQSSGIFDWEFDDEEIETLSLDEEEDAGGS